jgi:hypothetical protein
MEPRDRELDEFPTTFEQLLATKNVDHPFDMKTPYGQSLSLHAFSKHYQDKSTLECRLKKPVSDADEESDGEVDDDLLQLTSQ